MLAQSEIDALLSGAIDFDQKDGGSSVNLADKNQSGEQMNRGRQTGKKDPAI
jgi:hypothetical protein